ncbi:hypothetical protein EDC96DRAFT_542132 [Choanephora cucurbitarum]|nr:hypothetical protein EDC96DRAFT_542132 [Choanephora cucurbitarum]
MASRAQYDEEMTESFLYNQIMLSIGVSLQERTTGISGKANFNLSRPFDIIIILWCAQICIIIGFVNILYKSSESFKYYWFSHISVPLFDAFRIEVASLQDSARSLQKAGRLYRSLIEVCNNISLLQ